MLYLHDILHTVRLNGQYECTSPVKKCVFFFYLAVVITFFTLPAFPKIKT